MLVYYQLPKPTNKPQLRPALVTRQREDGRANLTVFLDTNDYGRGVGENDVRRGYARIQDVSLGDGPGQWRTEGPELRDAQPKAASKGKGRGSGKK